MYACKIFLVITFANLVYFVIIVSRLANSTFRQKCDLILAYTAVVGLIACAAVFVALFAFKGC